MTQLKLAAFDDEDLNVLSAHLQDAVLRVGDIAYQPKHLRFAAIANRFDWAKALAGSGNHGTSNERRRTALRFERVTSAQLQGINLDAVDTVVELLAIRFDETDAPAGTITLIFAGAATIRLQVECVEAELKDLGPVWRTKSRPDHPSEPG